MIWPPSVLGPEAVIGIADVIVGPGEAMFNPGEAVLSPETVIGIADVIVGPGEAMFNPGEAVLSPETVIGIADVIVGPGEAMFNPGEAAGFKKAFPMIPFERASRIDYSSGKSKIVKFGNNFCI